MPLAWKPVPETDEQFIVRVRRQLANYEKWRVGFIALVLLCLVLIVALAWSVHAMILRLWGDGWGYWSGFALGFTFGSYLGWQAFHLLHLLPFTSFRAERLLLQYHDELQMLRNDHA